jgi:hypothetical protein
MFQRFQTDVSAPLFSLRWQDVFDNLPKGGSSRVINTYLNEVQWIEASTPVRSGDIGVRRVASLAISAYLTSAASTPQLTSL